VAQFEIVRRFGIRVLEVVGLGEDVIYVADASLALIDSGLSLDQRSLAADWVLSEMTRVSISPGAA